jgi:CelD/BcsL family acetyltransferase involved in cellulose biosynthesis
MATITSSLEQTILPPPAVHYSCRTVAGHENLAGLEAKWPSVDIEAAAEIVGRELLGAGVSTSAEASKSRVESVTALRSEILGDDKWGGPMASFGWNLAAATALAEEQTAELVMAHDADGILRAVAPLALSTGFGSCRCEMLGVRRLNEPADFVYADRNALAALVEGILRSRRPLLLNRIPAHSPTIEALRRAARGRAVVAVRPQASCPFIPLDETWSTPESHFSSRRRSDFRRAMRRAERHGTVRGEVIVPTIENLDRLLKIAFDIEARSWKGAAGTALACDPIRGNHLRQFAHWATKAGTLRIALLWIGREPVAMQIATEESGRWWLLKIGFDPAWSDCSAGNLLLGETVRYAVRQQLATYEFLGTAETWTKVWTPHERQCVSVRVYPFGLRGAAVLAADAVQIALRHLADRRKSWRERRRGPATETETARSTHSEDSDNNSTD